MKRKVSIVSLLSIALLMIATTAISAKVGWTNYGWSAPNWHLKACNSKTTVYDSPRYSRMNATAEIGGQSQSKPVRNPSPNSSTHAVVSSGYNETCYTKGIAE